MFVCKAGPVTQRCFIKKVFLIFSKMQRKTPRSVALFNKIAGFHPTTLLKKRLQHRFFFLWEIEHLRMTVPDKHAF